MEMTHNKELLELILIQITDIRRTLVNCNNIENITGNITTTINVLGSNVIELNNVKLNKSDLYPSLFQCRYYISEDCLTWYEFYISSIEYIVFNRFEEETTTIYQDGEWLC
jgi:hypothetical protein